MASFWRLYVTTLLQQLFDPPKINDFGGRKIPGREYVTVKGRVYRTEHHSSMQGNKRVFGLPTGKWLCDRLEIKLKKPRRKIRTIHSMPTEYLARGVVVSADEVKAEHLPRPDISPFDVPTPQELDKLRVRFPWLSFTVVTERFDRPGGDDPAKQVWHAHYASFVTRRMPDGSYRLFGRTIGGRLEVVQPATVLDGVAHVGCLAFDVRTQELVARGNGPIPKGFRVND